MGSHRDKLDSLATKADVGGAAAFVRQDEAGEAAICAAGDDIV